MKEFGDFLENGTKQKELKRLENIHIVHYNEQHPNEGRCQKYR